jgi:XisI protein
MDKPVADYRTIITEVLRYYAGLPSITRPDDQTEEQLILDTERDHYQILTIGWEQGKRVYYPVFHLDIKNGKIWVQEDATDFDLVGELERRGVPKHDIVLGFHPAYKRAMGEYAVA